MQGTPTILRPTQDALAALLAQEDTDKDNRITVADKGPRRFELPLLGGAFLTIRGTYALANLVQELTLQRRAGEPTIDSRRIVENPVDRLSRQIQDRFWDALTRRIDEHSLKRVLADPKTDATLANGSAYSGLLQQCTSSHDLTAQLRFLYVAHEDPRAFDYYAALARNLPWLVVCKLPAKTTPEWVQSLSATATRPSRHGLLGLAIRGHGPTPYVVPGGRFNELYGWDSYFHVLGLVEDRRSELARAVVENLLYEVQHYGQILNANRSYYLTRSQPPLLSSMVRAVWEHENRLSSRQWLKRAVSLVIREYEQVWTRGARTTSACRGAVCLSRYHDSGLGQPPEVESGHFDWLYAQIAQRGDEGAAGQDYREHREQALVRDYAARRLPEEQSRRLNVAFAHDRCMRESGHDTTYRWFDLDAGEDRCADFATIDLNSLLLKYELDIARLLRDELPGQIAGMTAEQWCQRAQTRLALIRDTMWDDARGMFFDYDVKNKRRSSYVAATALYPLWATADNACGLRLFDDHARVVRLVRNALEQLEQPGGLASSARLSAEGPRLALAKRLRRPEQELQRQWDFPNGWAPHQVLAWVGLRHHGFADDADRLSYKWISMIVENARDYHGTVPEKFDVVGRTHRVFAEYGNVGTDFAYITEEGFGWMNASFQIGLAAFAPELRDALRRAAAAEAGTPIPCCPKARSGT